MRMEEWLRSQRENAEIFGAAAKERGDEAEKAYYDGMMEAIDALLSNLPEFDHEVTLKEFRECCKKSPFYNGEEVKTFCGIDLDDLEKRVREARAIATQDDAGPLKPIVALQLLSRACNETECGDCDFLQYNSFGSPYCWLWSSEEYPENLYDAWIRRRDRKFFCSEGCPDRESCEIKGEFIDNEGYFCRNFSDFLRERRGRKRG